MEKYEQLMIVGEGSYGTVMKCRHRETGQLVAIKKFLDTEEELTARRMALREIRMLKKLRHENLVCLLEVFRIRKRFHLVFEFVDRTVLDELEERGGLGLGEQNSRERIFQVIRAVRYCHVKHIIHRDVKPENVLVSRLGVVKLCDFGFARLLATPGEPCTEYVATRWYRAPELLVADIHYGPTVDVWAIGCLYSEMMTGKPMFPGDSDIDQLYRICKLLGQPCYRHQQLMARNPAFKPLHRTSIDETSRALFKMYPNWSHYAIDFLAVSMKMDPSVRATTDELIRHPYFNYDRFFERFLPKLRQKVLQEYQDNPLVRKYQSEILTASEDRRIDQISERMKKGAQIETPKWRINLQDPYVKKKTSLVSFSTLKQLDSENTSNRNNYFHISEKGPPRLGHDDKLNLVQSISQRIGQSLAKFEQRKQELQVQLDQTDRDLADLVENDNITQKGSDKLETEKNFTQNELIDSENLKERVGSAKQNVELHLEAPSPPLFQSLQPESFSRKTPPELINKSQPSTYSNQNILHPTINNLIFNSKDIPRDIKRSSQTLPTNQKIKDLSNTTFKSLQAAFNKSPVPLINPQREQLLKKINRGLVLDVSQLGLYNDNIYGGTKTPPAWLNTAGYTTYKKNTVEHTTWTKLDTPVSGVGDKSSFPTLIGASSSPYKSQKKRLPPQMQLSQDQNFTKTPRDSSSKSQPPPKNKHNLPFMFFNPLKKYPVLSLIMWCTFILFVLKKFM